MKLLSLILALTTLASVQAHAEADLIYPLAQKDGYAYYISASLSQPERTAKQICNALGYATMVGYDVTSSDKVGADQVAYAEFIKLSTPGNLGGMPLRNGPFTGWSLGNGSSSMNVLRDSGISLGGSSSIGYYHNETINVSVFSVIACDNKTGERNAMGRKIQLQKGE